MSSKEKEDGGLSKIKTGPGQEPYFWWTFSCHDSPFLSCQIVILHRRRATDPLPVFLFLTSVEHLRVAFEWRIHETWRPMSPMYTFQSLLMEMEMEDQHVSALFFLPFHCIPIHSTAFQYSNLSIRLGLLVVGFLGVSTPLQDLTHWQLIPLKSSTDKAMAAMGPRRFRALCCLLLPGLPWRHQLGTKSVSSFNP